MRLIFAGTPAFAAVALELLIQSDHQVVAVYTQQDKPAGRGLKLTPSPVKTLALSHGLPVYQPISLKNEAEQAVLSAFDADVMVVAAYGMLLPETVLSIPRFGCINIHPSLLPRWRGAAPIQRAVLAGDRVTGVTIMQMDKGLDTGPILVQHAYAMEEEETSATLHDQLAVMGAQALLETLTLLAQHQLTPIAQDNTKAVYAAKINKEEARIDWQRPASDIDRQIRAFTPWPIAVAEMAGQPLRIGRAAIGAPVPVVNSQTPGTILEASESGIVVMTGDGVITLLQLQLPGGKMLAVKDFYHARREALTPGNVLT